MFTLHVAASCILAVVGVGVDRALRGLVPAHAGGAHLAGEC